VSKHPDAISLAKRLIRLHQHPPADPDVANMEWERLALALANAVIASPPAAALGRLGGRSTTDAKAAAARENGKRGGRPRKQQTDK
jgi:hypothetical protein